MQEGGIVVPEEKQEVELRVERLGINGEGVGRLDQWTLFVDGALPGEEVRAEVYERRKTFGRARVTGFRKVSPHRVEPVCPLFGTCGGCQVMHLAYEQQLEAKRQRVIDALERIGKFRDVVVLPCEPSPLPLGYRNKIQLPVDDGKIGLYARGSHDVVEVDHCFLHCDLGEEVLQKIRPLLRAPNVQDRLKHLLVKTAVHTQQVLVVLVTRGEHFPAGLGEQILAVAPAVRGVVQSIHAGGGNNALGAQFSTLAGQGWIEETLLGFHFKVSPASFFQVNPAQAEKLYQSVVAAASLQGNETVLDAYCGVGTLSLFLAQRARAVIGIESVPEAIADARENATRNGCSHVQFHCGRAEELMQHLPAIDVAVLNPPRKGCEPAFLTALVERRPKRMIYVSCDPATLARDLQILASQGYTLESVQPFDMFPQTSHVECLAILAQN